LKSWRLALLLQDRWQEGTFTCTLLPSEIEDCYFFLYHSQQHDYEGLLFYVEEFSNATRSCMFAH
jgi:hypothetical protein